MRTVLIDGSLQFGDMRALLKVPTDAPSLLDLPTDRIQESDLADVLWRDPSGIDILLAPPRVEHGRDGHRPRPREDALAAAPRLRGRHRGHAGRRQRHQPRLPRRVGHDPRDRHLRLDHDPQHDGRWPTRSGSIGYPPTKVRYLVNRADSTGGIDPDDAGQGARARARALRRVGRRAGRPGQQRGHPVRPRRPGAADQPGHRPGRSASSSAGDTVRGRRRGARGRVSDPRPIGVFDSGRRRPDGPARDPAPAAARVHDLPRRQRPRAVRRRDRTTRSSRFSPAGARRARRSAT